MMHDVSERQLNECSMGGGLAYLSPNHHLIISSRGATMYFVPLHPGKNSATLWLVFGVDVTRTRLMRTVLST
jgi:hypothetical protein